MLNNLKKNYILFFIGGILYLVIELTYRGFTHWTMAIVGGLCFLLVGLINKFLPWETPLWEQSLIGGTIVTIVEFISGVIINLILKWNVWNYTLPFNVLGQICLPFFFIWCLLSIVGIILDDYLRYKLFNERKPYYRIF